jgi:hypothetical protein
MPWHVPSRAAPSTRVLEYRLLDVRSQALRNLHFDDLETGHGHPDRGNARLWAKSEEPCILRGRQCKMKGASPCTDDPPGGRVTRAVNGGSNAVFTSGSSPTRKGPWATPSKVAAGRLGWLTTFSRTIADSGMLRDTALAFPILGLPARRSTACAQAVCTA